MTFIPDVNSIALNPRPGYESMIIAGAPKAQGRIVAVSADGRSAQAVWRGTPGTYRFEPELQLKDTAYIVTGRATVRQPNKPDVLLVPGTLVQFPSDPFEFEITEPFLKVSFLYNPDGLNAEAEPLE